MRILLVEDGETAGKREMGNEPLRRFLDSALKEWEAAGEGQALERLVGSNAYEWVLLNWNRASEDSLRLIRQLRAGGYRAAAVLYLHDPGAPDSPSLPGVAGLPAAAGKPPARGALAYGDIRLHAAAHAVFVENSAVELTHKEFQLLNLFMLNPGQVLTKKEILERLWNAGAAPNAVEIYVHYLRKKLGPAAAAIHTVRGVGYRFGEVPGRAGRPGDRA